MDPNATLAEILSALRNQAREDAIWSLRDLADWLDRDGFFPTVEA